MAKRALFVCWCWGDTGFPGVCDHHSSFFWLFLVWCFGFVVSVLVGFGVYPIGFSHSPSYFKGGETFRRLFYPWALHFFANGFDDEAALVWVDSDCYSLA